jgi:hypothetical protein
MAGFPANRDETHTPFTLNGAYQMTVRAKFQVAEIRRYAWDMARGEEASAEVILQCQYDSKLCEEDRSFAKSTPTGKISMRVDNPKAIAALQLGAFFYVDFTPVEQ